MKVRKDLNTMEIENLIKIINAVSESELTGLKYEVDGVKLHLTKKQGKEHWPDDRRRDARSTFCAMNGYL